MADSPFLAGNFAPVADERDVADCRVDGRLPAGLAGTLYRNGPNPHMPPAEPYHWFTGDGMVHAITLADGRASYCNRWVRTQRFEAEAKAGHALFAGFNHKLAPSAEAIDTGVANTHVLSHAGRLLALEEAHLPVRLNPRDLATIGTEDFGGVLKGRFTAHPKRDPVTGELVFFSYSATGPLTPTLSWGTITGDGHVSAYEVLDAPYCSMAHDFAVSATHVIFPVLPLTGDADRAIAGGAPFAWDGARQGFLGIMRRDQGRASLRWVAFDPCFAFHVMNAFDDGDDVVVDVVEYGAAPLFPNADGSPPNPAATRSHLARWRVDATVHGPVRREILDDWAGEFPRIDERRAGLPYRHGYRICGLDEGEAIVHHDLATRTRSPLKLQNGDRASEAVFVPASPRAAEGEGWLLSVVWQPASETSTLWIIDAQAVADGPVASVALPRRVPFGFHGSWLPA